MAVGINQRRTKGRGGNPRVIGGCRATLSKGPSPESPGFERGIHEANSDAPTVITLLLLWSPEFVECLGQSDKRKRSKTTSTVGVGARGRK